MVGMLVGVWMAAIVVSVPSMYLRRRDVQENVQDETVCHVSDDIGECMGRDIKRSRLINPRFGLGQNSKAQNNGLLLLL